MKIYKISGFMLSFLMIMLCLFPCWHCSAETGVCKNFAQKSFYAVLDIDRVVNNSIAYKEFKDRWGAVNDKYQKEIEFYESQLLSLEQKVTKGNASRKDIMQAKKKIGIYEVKVQKLLRKRKEVLEQAGSKAIEILRKNIDKFIYDYAKQNQLSIIFAKDQVVYFANSIDVTDLILKQLNGKLKNLEVEIL